MAIKTKIELRNENDTSITANGSKENTGERVHDLVENIIDSYVNENDYAPYYDATVGTGGDYSTIQLALADGKYVLKIISDITETVDWGSHTKDIVLIADEIRTINVSVSNTSALTIKGNNIIFAVTGTNQIFNGGSLICDYVKITGDSDANIFSNGMDISGRKLEVDLGTNSLSTSYINNMNHLKITGGSTANPLVFILNGVIGYLETYGQFGTNSTQGGLRLSNCTINQVNCNNDGAIFVAQGENVNINGSVGKGMIIYPRSNWNFRNCNIEILQEYANSSVLVENCTVERFPTGKLFFKSFRGNTVIDPTNLFTGTREGNFSHNTYNDSFTIYVSNISLLNPTVASGTITVDATADKTTIIGARTLTSIVNNGTNTTLLGNVLV